MRRMVGLILAMVLMVPAGATAQDMSSEPSPENASGAEQTAQPSASPEPLLPPCPRAAPTSPEADLGTASPDPGSVPSVSPVPGVDCAPTLASVADLRANKLQGISLKAVERALVEAETTPWYRGRYGFGPSCTDKSDDERRLPDAARRLAREIGCLGDMVSIWMAYASQYPEFEWPGSFDTVLAAYSWAADALGPSGARYLDRGLSRIEAGPEPPYGKALKGKRKSASSIVTSPPARPVPAARVFKLMHDAYAANVERLVNYGLPYEQGFPLGIGFASTQPGYQMNGCMYPRGGQMEEFSQSMDCAGSVASAWVMYDLSGDERFYTVAKALNDRYLAGADSFYGREYRKRVPCFVKKDATSC